MEVSASRPSRFRSEERVAVTSDPTTGLEALSFYLFKSKIKKKFLSYLYLTL
jgi:hypothetical protein